MMWSDSEEAVSGNTKIRRRRLFRKTGRIFILNLLAVLYGFFLWFDLTEESHRSAFFVSLSAITLI